MISSSLPACLEELQSTTEQCTVSEAPIAWACEKRSSYDETSVEIAISLSVSSAQFAHDTDEPVVTAHDSTDRAITFDLFHASFMDI